jgi:ParB family chromosome partitioning protein
VTRRKGEIDRSFFDDMLGQVEDASSPAQREDVALERLSPRPDQFRRTFDAAAIEALAASIAEVGLLEPIVVREQGDRFEIVAGERRYRALRRLGWKRAPVRVVALDDAQAQLANAVENLNREDLNPLEEVDAVLSVLQHALSGSREDVVAAVTRARSLELEGEGLIEGNTSQVASLFQRLGYTSINSFYANRLSLLRYPEDLLQAMRERGLAYTKARLLARVKDPEVRAGLIEATLQEDLSVEEVEARVHVLAQSPQMSPGLFDDFGRIKRRITRRRVQQLDAAGQKRLRRLLRELEGLFGENEKSRIM